MATRAWVDETPFSFGCTCISDEKRKRFDCEKADRPICAFCGKRVSEVHEMTYRNEHHWLSKELLPVDSCHRYITKGQYILGFPARSKRSENLATAFLDNAAVNNSYGCADGLLLLTALFWMAGVIYEKTDYGRYDYDLSNSFNEEDGAILKHLANVAIHMGKPITALFLLAELRAFLELCLDYKYSS